MVRPVFARNVLGARGLRDDHYVRALPEGAGLRLINDIPASTAFCPAGGVGGGLCRAVSAYRRPPGKHAGGRL